MCVGQKIKAYLEENGITQTFVASKSGISLQKLNLSLKLNCVLCLFPVLDTIDWNDEFKSLLWELLLLIYDELLEYPLLFELIDISKFSFSFFLDLFSNKNCISSFNTLTSSRSSLCFAKNSFICSSCFLFEYKCLSSFVTITLEFRIEVTFVVLWFKFNLLSVFELLWLLIEAFKLLLLVFLLFFSYIMILILLNELLIVLFDFSFFQILYLYL